MSLTPLVAQAILDWDARLFQVQQTIRHAEAMVAPLAWARMGACSKMARRIFMDVRMQYRTGELMSQMRERFAEENPAVFADPTGAELLRQFTKIAAIFYELSDDEAESDYGKKIIADHAAYIHAATNAVEEHVHGTA